jgi:hypothetical protein
MNTARGSEWETGVQGARAGFPGRRWRLGLPILSAILLAVSAACMPALAQMAPRRTGAMVLASLDKAQQAVAARAGASRDTHLATARDTLAGMMSSLRASLGGDADKPVDILDARERADALRAQAAAQRVQAWLEASSGTCAADEAAAMAAALDAGVGQLAHATGSQKAPLPVVDGIETMDRRPLFVLRQHGPAPVFALLGENLLDAQCANPTVTATDLQGRTLDAQPRVTAVQASRIELAWPGAAALPPGSYVLHVASKRKAFLRGCTAQPDAVAALQVAPPLRFSVGYALVAVCGGSGDDVVPLGQGTLPDITARGAMASQAIDTSACPAPTSYTVTAAVRAADGKAATVGPITQSADATITAGLPGGLTLSWDPSVRRIFVRSGVNACKGVY